MKEQLMNTAIELWKEKGYDAVSIPMICKSCGVTKGSFYHHYKSKDDVLLSYFKIKEKPMLAEMLTKVVIEPVYIEKVWIFLEYYTKMAMELGPELIMNLIRTDMKQKTNMFPLVTNEEEAKDSEYSSYHMLLSIFREGQKQGEIRDEIAAEKLIEMLEASFTGLTLYWSAAQNQFDLLERQHELMQMILRPGKE